MPVSQTAHHFSLGCCALQYRLKRLSPADRRPCSNSSSGRYSSPLFFSQPASGPSFPSRFWQPSGWGLRTSRNCLYSRPRQSHDRPLPWPLWSRLPSHPSSAQWAKFLSIWSMFSQVAIVAGPLAISGTMLVSSLPVAFTAIGSSVLGARPIHASPSQSAFSGSRPP